MSLIQIGFLEHDRCQPLRGNSGRHHSVEHDGARIHGGRAVPITRADIVAKADQAIRLVLVHAKVVVLDELVDLRCVGALVDAVDQQGPGFRFRDVVIERCPGSKSVAVPDGGHAAGRELIGVHRGGIALPVRNQLNHLVARSALLRGGDAEIRGGRDEGTGGIRGGTPGTVPLRHGFHRELSGALETGVSRPLFRGVSAAGNGDRLRDGRLGIHRLGRTVRLRDIEAHCVTVAVRHGNECHALPHRRDVRRGVSRRMPSDCVTVTVQEADTEP